jgi:predicted phosphodiesterase
MKNNLYRFSAFILMICSVQFSNGQNLEITHGPFLQSLTTSSVVVNWSSSKDCISWVEFYEDDGSHFYQKEREKIFASRDGLKTIGKLHKVTLNKLKPATKYKYRIYSLERTEHGYFGEVVATDVYKKRPLHFTTPEAEKNQSSCIILSDMHGRDSMVGSLLDKVEWNETDFVILNGDFINTFDDEDELYSVLDTCVSIFAKEKPIYAIRGNHETRGLKALELKQYLHFPEDKYYYAFSSGKTFYIVLDSGEDKPDSDIEYHGLNDFERYRENQAIWLSELVESEDFKNAEQKVVFMHIPPYYPKGGREWHGPLESRRNFVPILNKAGIDLMLCGHRHRYAFVPEKEGENNFPIIISDNKSRIDLQTDHTGINVRITDPESKVISELFFNNK